MDIINTTTFGAWKAGLKAITDQGREYLDEDDKRSCVELTNFIVTIENPSEDILKPIEYLNELNLWVYPPIDELTSVILTKRKIPTIQYTYGSRLFNFQRSINQIHDYVIPKLKSDPASRRAIAMLYDPTQDSKLHHKEIPSLIFLFFQIRDEKLHVTGCVRSNDFFVGWPTNVFQVFKLQELVAKELDLKIGSLSTMSNSAHVYKEYAESIKKLVNDKMPLNSLP
ncbi:MAG: hypothetical protein KKG59_03870 [Nanoarchaeota archaeon]|nr:hypothetical protein [Nanoarchaeota archaeon]